MPRTLMKAAALLLLATTACSTTPAPAPTTAPATSTVPSQAAPTSQPATSASSAARSSSAGSPSPATASARRTDAASQDLVRATTKDVAFEGITPPATLAQDLRKGGYVIVFRYTGSGGSASPVPEALKGRVKDDGQRISDASVTRMKAYGDAFRTKQIPVSRVVSSEYYFVWQHADAAFGEPIDIHRDLTGSLDFSDRNELEASLQALRDRTVTPPDPGSNTVLFTHQGKFDKAYGFYPDAGTSIIFRPDGSGTPRVVAVLGLDEFLRLGT